MNTEVDYISQEHIMNQLLVSFVAVCTGIFSVAARASQSTAPATQPARANPMKRLTSVVNAYACFSPDGKTIAYQSNATGNWDIYLMNIDATGVHPIVSSPAADITPVFSPD